MARPRLCRAPECETYFAPRAHNHVYCGSQKKKTGCSYRRKISEGGRYAPRHREYFRRYARSVGYPKQREWRRNNRAEFNRGVVRALQRTRMMFFKRYRWIPGRKYLTIKNFNVLSRTPIRKRFVAEAYFEDLCHDGKRTKKLGDNNRVHNVRLPPAAFPERRDRAEALHPRAVQKIR